MKTKLEILTTKNAHPGHPLYDKTRMNALQEQVFAMGICPRCHKKLLCDGHASYGIQSVSCACGLLILRRLTNEAQGRRSRTAGANVMQILNGRWNASFEIESEA